MNFILGKKAKFVKEVVKQCREEAKNYAERTFLCDNCYTSPNKCGHYPEHCYNEFLRAKANAEECKKK